MVLLRGTRLFLAVAGGGAFIGICNYFQKERKTVKLAWTNNFEPSVKWDYNWDKRHYCNVATDGGDSTDQVAAKEQKPTARRHILLIRHGQYNLNGLTDKDRGLTDIGKMQADLIGKRLKELKFDYTKIVRSTMARAQETSNIIHKHFPNLPVEDCDLLREGSPILPDPVPVNWAIRNEIHERDGARIEAAFEKHFHRADVNQTSDSFEIFVCHANVIRYFVCRLLQFPPQAWLRFQLHHCSLTWVVIVPSGHVGVITVGDSGFIPQELMTG